MDTCVTLTSLDQVKALADPLRQRILRAICCDPATTKQIATELGEKPTRLYHHVDQLEKAGLIELVETRPNRGTVEKYYCAVASQFRIDQDLLRVGKHNISTEMHAVLVNTLQDSLVDACDLFDPGAIVDDAPCCTMLMIRAQRNLTETQARKLVERIQACLQEIEQESATTDPTEQTYALTVAFYPTRPD